MEIDNNRLVVLFAFLAVVVISIASNYAANLINFTLYSDLSYFDWGMVPIRRSIPNLLKLLSFLVYVSPIVVILFGVYVIQKKERVEVFLTVSGALVCLQIAFIVILFSKVAILVISTADQGTPIMIP